MPIAMNPPHVAGPAPALPLTPDIRPRGPDRIDLREHWRSIAKRRWVILGIGLMAALLAAAVVMAVTPVYRSTATVLIESGKSKIVSIDEVYSGVSQDREHYQTQIEILRSREVARRTVQAVRLWEYPEFDPRKGEDGALRRLKRALRISEPPATWDEEALTEATVPAFSGALTVEPVRLSQLVKVSVEAQDRQLAARLANETAQRYIEADRDARFRITQQANGWLQERMGSLREKVAQSERELQEYREQNGLVNLGGSAQSMAGQQVGEVMQRLVSARVRRTELESAYQQITAIRNGDYSSVPAVVNHAAVAEARRRLSVAQTRLEELSHTYGDQHTRVVEAQTEVGGAREDLQRQTRAVINALSREYLAARDTEASLQAALGTARGTVQDVNRREFQLSVLEREVQANRQLYELFMSRAKETNLGGGLQAAVARVVDPAGPSSVPLKPNKRQVIVFALLLGLLAGAAGAVTLDRLDNTLKRAEDAETRLHQPVLTTLPLIGTEHSQALTRLFLEQPQSHHAEAIRTARTGVLLSNIDVEHKVLLVTSSVPGEGKTTLCTNLALAHAQTKRTLLIDADMRRPQIGRRLGVPADAKGLSNLVAGTARLEECLHPVAGSGLLVMPAGDVPPNPLELLLSQRFREALQALSRQVEIILIDSPPVELVSDALVLAPQASSTIYVVKAMHTPHPLARKGILRLQRAGGTILGVVLNQLEFERNPAYYGDGDAGYGYANYAGYGQPPTSRPA